MWRECVVVVVVVDDGFARVGVFVRYHVWVVAVTYGIVILVKVWGKTFGHVVVFDVAVAHQSLPFHLFRRWFDGTLVRAGAVRVYIAGVVAVDVVSGLLRRHFIATWDDVRLRSDISVCRSNISYVRRLWWWDCCLVMNWWWCWSSSAVVVGWSVVALSSQILKQTPGFVESIECNARGQAKIVQLDLSVTIQKPSHRVILVSLQWLLLLFWLLLLLLLLMMWSTMWSSVRWTTTTIAACSTVTGPWKRNRHFYWPKVFSQKKFQIARNAKDVEKHTSVEKWFC